MALANPRPNAAASGRKIASHQPPGPGASAVRRIWPNERGPVGSARLRPAEPKIPETTGHARSAAPAPARPTLARPLARPPPPGIARATAMTTAAAKKAPGKNEPSAARPTAAPTIHRTRRRGGFEPKNPIRRAVNHGKPPRKTSSGKRPAESAHRTTGDSP